MTGTFTAPLVNQLADFVRSTGIDVQPSKITWKTQFPGLDIRAGAVLVDESQLIHPGNILHEAGHIAVHDPEKRKNLKFQPGRGEELSALAWSYAATVHLKLDMELVFYPGSFHGWSTALVENFKEERYVGIPLLQRFGMSYEPRLAAVHGVAPYPHMVRWIR
ncbi:MAG TPA: hypothetical protein VI306_08805 [Pyrinomonadaceae bacterium]